jgi:hypothetical protein
MQDVCKFNRAGGFLMHISSKDAISVLQLKLIGGVAPLQRIVPCLDIHQYFGEKRFFP